MTEGATHGMGTPSAPVSSAGLRRRLYAMSFADEFGPIYAVYTLWFNDVGVSASQISAVFMSWAVIAIVLEIPSGALADRIDRRHLVAAAFAIRAVGISIWFLWPTFGGAITGAMLFAVHSSIASGAWQALIHDELEAIGESHHYAIVMARISQFSNLAIATASATALLMLQLGSGLEPLGWVTVAVHAISFTLVLRLPDVSWVVHGDGDRAPWSYQAWWSTLRTGVREARTVPLVAKLVVAGALLEGLFVIDEYVPLLARDRGAADEIVPVLVIVVWVGLLLGGEYVIRRPAVSGRALGTALAAGTVASAVGLATGRLWPLLTLALCYAALEAAYVVTDARLQERAPSATRATVTSVRSFISGLVAMAAFATVGALTSGDDPTRGLYLVMATLIVAALLLIAWLPDRSDPDTSRQQTRSTAGG